MGQAERVDAFCQDFFPKIELRFRCRRERLTFAAKAANVC